MMIRRRPPRLLLLFLGLSVWPATFARGEEPGWNAEAAACYLDERATAWFAYDGRGEGATRSSCLSCHTMLPYALARPVLGGLSGAAKSEPETKLLAQTAMRVEHWADLDSQAFGLYYDRDEEKKRESWGTEAVFNAVVLACDDQEQGRTSPSEATKRALTNLWATQLQSGDRKGAWEWLDFNEAPWGIPPARYFGAALAAIAVATAPGYDSAADQAARAGLPSLQNYLRTEFDKQDLHNQAWGLWAAAKLPGILTTDQRQQVIERLLERQREDGGWSLPSLGAWQRNDGTPQEDVSDGYATGLVLHVVQMAGLPQSHAKVARGLIWLKTNQSADGAWHCASLVKKRDPNSHTGKFMSDAATAFAVLALSHADAAMEAIKVEVRETAGVRRFGYPISLKLPQLALAPGKARLRDGDRPIPVQFRQQDDGTGTWWVDFNLSLMPDEVRIVTLEYGADVKADPEPRGLELKHTPDGLEIRNGPHLTWTTGRAFNELLKSVDAGDLHHLRPGGVRFSIAGAEGVLDGEQGNAPRILRSGPLAVVLRYEFASPGTHGVKSTIDLTFPVSKSWVEVDWQIDDPRQAVRSSRVEIEQNLHSPTDKEPTLVDFGASSLVYMSLTPGTAGKLHAQPTGRPAWEVLRGATERLEPFVVRSSGAESGGAEGWAHIMDRERCLALAVGDFGRHGDDSIEATAEGQVSLVRRFFSEEADRAQPKHFHFWLHFVGFPPHLTAATSPQAMLSPLVVRISGP